MSAAALVSGVDLADCASEPIRIPGYIQPHGYLLAFDERTRILQHVSVNVFALGWQCVCDILGHPHVEWLAPGDLSAFDRALDVPETFDQGASIPLMLNGQSFDARVHRIDGLSILEFEPALASTVTSEPILARALRRLQSAGGLPSLHEVTVLEVRALTGFDRVVVYAFGEEGHGRVLAEAKADEAASYLGLTFPASDIPTQARELYKLNWLRMIPDVDYEPVPIVGLQSAASRAPLDLSLSSLRSVSPVHREYMRHMGARSSMSISLLRDGELWGLISCVHHSPKLVAPAVRSACLSIGRLLSLQISAMETLHESRLASANRGWLDPLVEQMRSAPDDVLGSLARAPDHLLPLTDAGGVAIVMGPMISSFGICPSEQQIADLCSWTADRVGPTGYFATSTLPHEYIPAGGFASVAQRTSCRRPAQAGPQHGALVSP